MVKFPREYGMAILLAALSGLMVLILLGEWWHFSSVRREVTGHVTAKPVQTDEPTDAPPEEPKPLPIENFDETVNRPLFTQSRRPPNEDEPVASEPEAPRTPLNAKLMGIVLTPSGQTALLVDAQGKYKRGRKNTAIDGWKLIEIKGDRVILEQAGEHKDLPLIKPKPKVAAAPGQPTKKPGRAIVTGPGQTAVPPEDTSESDDADTSDEETDAMDEEDTGADEESSDAEQ